MCRTTAIKYRHDIYITNQTGKVLHGYLLVTCCIKAMAPVQRYAACKRILESNSTHFASLKLEHNKQCLAYVQMVLKLHGMFAPCMACSTWQSLHPALQVGPTLTALHFSTMTEMGFGCIGGQRKKYGIPLV